MPKRLNIFNKIVLLLAFMLVPILLLYGYTNRITNEVLREQIEGSNLNQLSFFLNRLDTDIERLSMQPIILSNNPYIREYVDEDAALSIERLGRQARIVGSLGLQSVSSGWVNDITIAIPRNNEILSSNLFVNGTTAWDWKAPIRREWTYLPPGAGQAEGAFVREVSEPFRAAAVEEARVLYRVRFAGQNITNLLNVYKQDRRGDPFLFDPAFGTIRNESSDAAVIGSIAERLRAEPLPDVGQRKLRIDGEELLVSYIRSEQLGWYLVDYVPVEEMLAPIRTTRFLFYLSSSLLLILSVLAAFLLYRNVQIPVRNIVRGVRQLKRGDFSARIEHGSNNEFDYLAKRVNEMAEKIQALIEDVYVERIRSREATLKQLQSQIHPHFLYNTLFFIINSAEMEDKDSVVAMAHNLAEYYRYTTRVENQTVFVKEELDFIRHYLTIQSLRRPRLTYSVSVPDAMLEERIPRLSLQPIVENAVVHGIERSAHGNLVAISGEQDETFNRLVIEDNGVGMSEERLEALRLQLRAPMSDEIGCGTWNVHHRLYYQFGEGSGLSLDHRPGGGMRVTLSWRRNTAIESSGEGVRTE